MAHNSPKPSTPITALQIIFACVLTFGLLLAPRHVQGDEPGRGLTGEFEVEFLKSIIDHHFSALRMTELAAGTDTTRDVKISPTEGTSPSPDFSSTPAKAHLDALTSLARRNNRMQREEILTAQAFLREWYGIDYTPRLDAEAEQAIAMLEEAEAGRAFDIEFIKVLSRHHFVAVQHAAECLVAADPKHKDLERYCRGILNSQLNDIDEMRHLLCDVYGICDYQPLEGMEGRHS
jgi:uncharacterized protein (DUF305 family)